jgi:hypothetical protein
MIEFNSEPPKSSSSLKIIMAGVCIVILLVGLLVYMNHKRSVSVDRGSPGSPGSQIEGMLRPGNTNFEYYKKKIKIDNLKASLGINFNNTRTAMISGTMTNEGDRTVEAVEIHISLYDVWGKLSKERTALILRPVNGMLGKPLGPLEKRLFSVGIESVELYWDPKQISYEITGLKYE